VARRPTPSFDISTSPATAITSGVVQGGCTTSSTLTASSGTGTAIIEAAGTITFTGNNQPVCAVFSTTTEDCDFTNCQGATGNTSMLSRAALNLKQAAAAINFAGNSESFQGSIWMPSSSKITFAKKRRPHRGPRQRRQLRHEHARRRTHPSKHKRHHRPPRHRQVTTGSPLGLSGKAPSGSPPRALRAASGGNAAASIRLPAEQHRARSSAWPADRFPAVG
jgi:hypothetical protein